MSNERRDSDGPVVPESEFGRIPGRLRAGFSSERGRREVNPFVDKIQEFRPWVVVGEDAEGFKGRWREVMGVGQEAPLVLEIGPGNGFFFRDLAARRPEAAVVGVEIRFKRVWMTAKKALDAGCTNFRVMHQSFGYLDTYFDTGELTEVYINHPDPWPKGKHHKHRLLQPTFGAMLASRLAPGGLVQVQSDFVPYGPLSRSVFANEMWERVAHTADLHGAPDDDPDAVLLRTDHITTNYESKKILEGERIFVGRYRRTSAPARRPTAAEELAALDAVVLP